MGEVGMFREISIETCIISRVKQITSPGWMHETSAQAWCTGKSQKDQVEREVGGGIGMGNTCKSMADSYQCMTRPLQYCNVISLQIKKNNNWFESVLMRWMKLEPIIQSEVSQKDKDQYNILTHIYWILEDGNDDPICKTEKETQMYRTDF